VVTGGMGRLGGDPSLRLKNGSVRDDASTDDAPFEDGASRKAPRGSSVPAGTPLASAPVPGVGNDGLLSDVPTGLGSYLGGLPRTYVRGYFMPPLRG
jgi:hypothetical protein